MFLHSFSNYCNYGVNVKPSVCVIMLSGAFSLVSAMLFVVMDAVDVALRRQLSEQGSQPF